MTFYVRDKATDEAVRRLAKLKGKTLTETIREAVEKEYRRSKEEIPLEERLERLAQRFAKFPKSGLEADKAFFDDLSGDI
jgi:antitoxin VapB